MMICYSCPFCGSKPEGCFTGLAGVNVTAVNCSNRDCIAHCRQVSIEQWNTRSPAVPQFEDTYKKENERLKYEAELRKDLIKTANVMISERDLLIESLTVHADIDYKEEYEKLKAFIERARQESDLITIQKGRDEISHKIQVPYWFMRDPE